MTKEEFNTLKVDKEVKIFDDETYIVKEIYAIQGIIMLQTKVTKEVFPVRYENCELVVEDKLKESDQLLICVNNRLGVEDDGFAKEIRSIVRKEVVDGLRFPALTTFMNALGPNNKFLENYEWLIKETKRLNKES